MRSKEELAKELKIKMDESALGIIKHSQKSNNEHRIIKIPWVDDVWRQIVDDLEEKNLIESVNEE